MMMKKRKVNPTNVSITIEHKLNVDNDGDDYDQGERDSNRRI